MEDQFYPKVARIDVTNRCNLRCKHCQASPFRSPDRNYSELTLDEMLSLITQLRDLGTQSIGILGGEPLARRDLPSILLHAKNLGIAVTVNTNGTLIQSRSDAEFLLNEAGASVSVSLDGTDPTTHEWLRGKGTFDKTIAAVRQLIEVRNSTRSLSRVGLSAVIHQKNLNSAERFLDLARELQVDSLVLQHVHHVGDAISNWADLEVSPELLIALTEHIVRRIRTEPLPRVHIFWMTHALAHYLKNVSGLDYPLRPIHDHSGMFECYIQCDGRVFPSQRMSEMMPLTLHGPADFRHNNIRERRLADIWFGEEFGRFRSFALDRSYIQFYKWCPHCRFAMKECIPAIAPHLAGDRDPKAMCSLVYKTDAWLGVIAGDKK